MNGSRWVSRLAFLIIASAAVSVFVDTARHFAGPQPFLGVWEDSLMLSRYAHNLATSGQMIWNPGGPPTYGLTSPYYFLSTVVPVAAFVTSKPLAIPMVASLISGLLFFVVMAITLRRLLPGPVVFRHIAMALVAIAMARSATDVATNLISGMDTCFAMLYFSIYIALLRWHSSSLTWLSATLAGFWGGLAFGARPDLLVWTMLVPLAWVLLGSRRQKSLGFGMLLVSVLVLALEIGVASVYFHSPLPLPFYAKSLQLYPGLNDYRYTGLLHIVQFLFSYWLLFVLIVLDVLVDARGWWRETSPLVKGLAAGTVVHMSYFLVGVTQIMPAAHRFYYPALPAIIFLAGCATVRLLERVPERWVVAVSQSPAPYRYAAFAIAILVLPPPPPNELSVFGALAHHNFASFDLVQECKAYLPNFWFGLDRFSALPSDATMATTEIGHVGAMNLDKTVVDLAGLNDSLFAHHRFSADVFFAHYHPDLIYMPHPGYKAMNVSLEDNPTFQRDYEWIPAAKLGPQWFMGIALSRTSKYYGEMRTIVKSVCADQLTGPCAWNPQ